MKLPSSKEVHEMTAAQTLAMERLRLANKDAARALLLEMMSSLPRTPSPLATSSIQELRTRVRERNK